MLVKGKYSMFLQDIKVFESFKRELAIALKTKIGKERLSMGAREDVIEALKKLDGEGTISQIESMITEMTGRSYKSLGTTCADLVINGNSSSPYREDQKCLQRTGRGKYCLIPNTIGHENVQNSIDERKNLETNKFSSVDILNRKQHYWIVKRNNIVEAWSNFRLPFEPKGNKKVFKKELRTSIQNLTMNQNNILQCSYLSIESPTSKFDVENILLYNVGQGAFTHLARNGIIIEGLFPVSDLPSYKALPIHFAPTHYIKYAAADRNTDYEYWRRIPNRYLEIKSIPCGEVTSNIKAAEVWEWIKRHIEKVSPFVNKFESITEYFSLDVTIKFPFLKSINLTSIIKSLYDGIVSSFHVYDSEHCPEVVSLISKELKISPDKASKWLLERRIGILGKRSYVTPDGSGLKWHPDDHLCMAGSIRSVTDPSVKNVLMDIRISEIGRREKRTG